MIANIILQIIGNWTLLGLGVVLILVSGLYFAILCEKIADYLYTH